MVGILKSKTASKVNKSIGIAQKAGLTTALKYTEGKELVELSPWSLIPDPDNPRPDELIDDAWLNRVLKLNSEESLCFVEGRTLSIPSFKSLSGDLGGVKEEDYEALIMLAKSIRHEGLIQPIEVFLADKKYEPSYFINRADDHGYVVLEGHQRRLAAMVAGVKTVTCIKIQDEAFIKQLQVKHRKLRRQLSENNLRKSLTPGQHYKIFQQLLISNNGDDNLTSLQLCEISGLSQKVCEVLKKLILAEEGRYPGLLYEKLGEGELSFRVLKDLVYKSFDEIILYFEPQVIKEKSPKATKSRGTQGGRTKKSATFKINSESDSLLLGRYIQQHIPGLDTLELDDSPYKNLEMLLKRLLEKAKEEV